MLSSPEEEILAKACEALYKFALKGLDFFSLLLNFISFLKYLPHRGNFSPLSLTYSCEMNYFSGNQNII